MSPPDREYHPQKQLQQNSEGVSSLPNHAHLELSDLPNELLIRIGAFVVKHYDLNDYIALSMVSKRWKRLLIDSESVVAEIIRLRLLRPRTRQQEDNLPENRVCIAAIRTLRQLNIYETIVQQQICSENRVHFDFADLNVEDRASIALIESVRTILKTHKAVSVLLEAHCGTPAPAEIAWLYSHYRGRVVSMAIVRGTESLPMNPETEDATLAHYDTDDLLGRVHIRAWGKMITEAVSQSKHPYGDLARQGRGWVEIFLRMEDPETGRFLLPNFENDLAKAVNEGIQSSAKMTDCFLAPSVYGFEKQQATGFGHATSALQQTTRVEKVYYPVPGRGLFR